MASRVSICPHNPDELCTCRFETCPCCGGLGVAMRCPGCDGAGAICTRTLREAQLAGVPPYERCEECKGRGWFPISEALYDRLGFKRPEVGDYLHRRRPPRSA
jgi:hypothetical protein